MLSLQQLHFSKEFVESCCGVKSDVPVLHYTFMYNMAETVACWIGDVNDPGSNPGIVGIRAPEPV